MPKPEPVLQIHFFLFFAAKFFFSKLRGIFAITVIKL